jgi:hypothetical protein
MQNNNQDSENELLEEFSSENISKRDREEKELPGNKKDSIGLEKKISFETKVKTIFNCYLTAYKSLPLNKISIV